MNIQDDRSAHRPDPLHAHDELERRVAERTQELEQANAALRAELAARQQADAEVSAARTKLEGLWGMASLANADLKTISDYIVSALTRITGSGCGFYGFVNDDESVMTIHAWSGEAMKDCSMVDKPQRFPIAEAGVWGEAIRRRASLILNDYGAAHPAKKGLPQGHVPLTNLLVVPLFLRGRIRAVAAVANRPEDYGQEDVQQITAFLGGAQAIVEGTWYRGSGHPTREA